MKTEDYYFDEKENKIKEFSIIKIFHFIGATRKKHYMYKWVRLMEFEGIKYWVALHLSDDSGDYFHLRSIADKDRILKGVEVVQERYDSRIYK
jgi:hypothetical protein